MLAEELHGFGHDVGSAADVAYDGNADAVEKGVDQGIWRLSVVFSDIKKLRLVV